MPRKRKWCQQSLIEAHERARVLRRARKTGNRLEDLLAQLQLARAHLPEDVLLVDADICDTAWLAYRYMSAYERTELFTIEYEKLYRKMHEMYIDTVEAANKQPAHLQLEMNDVAEMTSLWKARQIADSLGMPYSVYLRAAMNTAVQERKHRQVQRPNQLTSEWQIEAATKAWAGERDTSTLFADDWDPRFFAPFGRTDPARMAAVAALVARIKSRPQNADIGLRGAIHMRQALSEPEARSHFDGELVDQVMRSPTDPLLELPTEAGPAYKPKCLGTDPSGSLPGCAGCEFAKLCRAAHTEVSKRLIALYGTDDPRKAKIKANATERKRRSRERQRQEAMSSAVVPALDG